MPEFDLVVKNGMIVDGTGAPRFRDDIGIKEGRIAKIGHIQPHEAAKVIDADGLIAAPGFIDLHTHYDAQIFWDPYLTISGWHGVTSVVIGNCGFGFAPVRKQDAERAMLTMVRTEAIPLASMQAALKVRLGDLSAIPGYARSSTEGRQPVALPADESVARLRHGHRTVQDRAVADRRRAYGNAPHPARSDGRGRVRLVGAAAGAERAVLGTA